MKARTILLALAATAMLFTACGEKENEENNNTNNNGGNGGGITNTDNMATVGTISSELVSNIHFDDFGTANISARSTDANRRTFFGAGIAWESLGRTLNLADPQNDEEYWFRYEVENNDDMLMFTQSNYSGEVNSDLGHEESTHNPVFTSGTLTTTRTSEGYTLVIDGTLKDGTTVLIRLKMAFTDEIIPLTKNSIIIDDVKYAITSTASQNPGTAVVSSSRGSRPYLLNSYKYITDNYVPTYPEAASLSMRQVEVMEHLIFADASPRRTQMMELLAEKVEHLLGIKDKENNTERFLTTIYNDFQYYAIEVV